LVKISHPLQVFLTLLATSIFAILLFVLIPIKNTQANFELENWEFSKPILLPSNLVTSKFVGFEPDKNIYANSTDNLADVRIIKESTQEEVPYGLLTGRSSESYQLLQAEIRDIANVASSHTSFVIKASPTSMHNQLEIITSSSNFVRKVQIETTNDLMAWSTVEDNAQIYDIAVSTGTPNHRNTKLTYPINSSDFLRITIFNNNHPPLEIQGTTLSLFEKIPGKYITYSSSVSSQEKVRESDSSQVVIDLKFEGIPTSRLEVFTSETNFNRNVTLESSSNSIRWTLVEQDQQFFVYDTTEIQRKQLQLSYPEVTSRYLRLTFLNADSPPLKINAIEIQGLQRLLIFEGRPDTHYNIYYGNLFEKTKPNYGMEQVILNINIENIDLAQLGIQESNQKFERRPIEPLSGRYPWLLPSAVAILIIILGMILIRILRLTIKGQ
jgi:hypothetical protein